MNDKFITISQDKLLDLCITEFDSKPIIDVKNLKKILDMGYDINHIDNEGNTLLYRYMEMTYYDSYEWYMLEIVELIKYGSDINIKDKQNHLPIFNYIDEIVERYQNDLFLLLPKNLENISINLGSLNLNTINFLLKNNFPIENFNDDDLGLIYDNNKLLLNNREKCILLRLLRNDNLIDEIYDFNVKIRNMTLENYIFQHNKNHEYFLHIGKYELKKIIYDSITIKNIRQI
jgi:hypothetical protein